MDSDILIAGSGVAGLGLALRLADRFRVTVLAKGTLTDSNSSWAQGGIAAVLNDVDSVAAHVRDTLIAGDGLCDEAAVEFTVAAGARNIHWLINGGVHFTSNDGNDSFPFHLTREGGHGQRRIIHAADSTGEVVVSSLLQQARAHPNIRLMEQIIAVDLIQSRKLGSDHNRCLGLYALDRTRSEVLTLTARKTVLATGGCGKAYLYTSNPDVATGDGIAMAWRAGCRVANMEFIQFHPTCLYHPQAKSFLISEALRGEGGRLLLPDGTRFMPSYDERAELAPRDIVARAIDNEIKRHGLDCVYLDISHQSADFIQAHFPTIRARCAELGIDITREPIPVVPAAHYLCGGILTDLQGRTDLPGLFAIGETACTGLHGANRLASNSLLECLVFAESAAGQILAEMQTLVTETPAIPLWDETRVVDSDEAVMVAHDWHELRQVMSDYVGIVRSRKRLALALSRLKLMSLEVAEYYRDYRISNDLIELRNLVTVAQLIVRSAMQRRESRGLHYSLDNPKRDNSRPARPTILTPDVDAAPDPPADV
ncbi:MAG: L-aspartate oxidase [Gammaproteobacteria bacterium]|nr:L-aspartate oxidase [Gammaproteobacteria bacterium]